MGEMGERVKGMMGERSAALGGESMMLMTVTSLQLLLSPRWAGVIPPLLCLGVELRRPPSMGVALPAVGVALWMGEVGVIENGSRSRSLAARSCSLATAGCDSCDSCDSPGADGAAVLSLLRLRLLLRLAPRLALRLALRLAPRLLPREGLRPLLDSRLRLRVFSALGAGAASSCCTCLPVRGGAPLGAMRAPSDGREGVVGLLRGVEVAEGC